MIWIVHGQSKRAEEEIIDVRGDNIRDDQMDNVVWDRRVGHCNERREGCSVRLGWMLVRHLCTSSSWRALATVITQSGKLIDVLTLTFVGKSGARIDP